MPAPENLTLASAGAKISMATSWHPHYSAENIIDGNAKTFWVTTGLFPQELILSLSKPAVIRKIIISSMKVAHWSIDISDAEKPANFERFLEQPVDDSERSLQVATLNVPATETRAHHLRLGISKGHGPFCSIHKIVLYGDVDS